MLYQQILYEEKAIRKRADVNSAAAQYLNEHVKQSNLVNASLIMQFITVWCFVPERSLQPLTAGGADQLIFLLRCRRKPGSSPPPISVSSNEKPVSAHFTNCMV